MKDISFLFFKPWQPWRILSLHQIDSCVEEWVVVVVSGRRAASLTVVIVRQRSEQGAKEARDRRVFYEEVEVSSMPPRRVNGYS